MPGSRLLLVPPVTMMLNIVGAGADVRLMLTGRIIVDRDCRSRRR